MIDLRINPDDSQQRLSDAYRQLALVRMQQQEQSRRDQLAYADSMRKQALGIFGDEQQRVAQIERDDRLAARQEAADQRSLDRSTATQEALAARQNLADQARYDRQYADNVALLERTQLQEESRAQREKERAERERQAAEEKAGFVTVWQPETLQRWSEINDQKAFIADLVQQGTMGPDLGESYFLSLEAEQSALQPQKIPKPKQPTPQEQTEALIYDDPKTGKRYFRKLSNDGSRVIGIEPMDDAADGDKAKLQRQKDINSSYHDYLKQGMETALNEKKAKAGTGTTSVSLSQAEIDQIRKTALETATRDAAILDGTAQPMPPPIEPPAPGQPISLGYASQKLRELKTKSAVSGLTDAEKDELDRLIRNMNAGG